MIALATPIRTKTARTAGRCKGGHWLTVGQVTYRMLDDSYRCAICAISGATSPYDRQMILNYHKDRVLTPMRDTNRYPLGGWST